MVVTSKSRLFYAIWPESEAREKLAEISRQFNNCRIIPSENLHITLLFLGQIEEPVQKSFLEITDEIQSKSFTIELSRTGIWKRPGVFWMAPLKTPVELTVLVDKLSEIAVRNHVFIQNRSYRPHVTLARKVTSKLQANSQVISWHVTEFSLVESKIHPQGANYRRLKTWTLT